MLVKVVFVAGNKFSSAVCDCKPITCVAMPNAKVDNLVVYVGNMRDVCGIVCIFELFQRCCKQIFVHGAGSLDVATHP